MRIRHKRSRHGHGQLAGVLHLLHRGRLKVLAPDSVRSVGLARHECVLGRRAINQELGKFRIGRIIEKCSRGCRNASEIIQHGRHASFCILSSLQNLLGCLRTATSGNADLGQISRFHDSFPFMPNRRLPDRHHFLRVQRRPPRSRNRRITAAFVVVCAVGFSVRNVPPPASAIGMRS